MKKVIMCHPSSVNPNEVYLVGNKEFMEWLMDMLRRENYMESDMEQSHELTKAWMKINECITKEMSQMEHSNEQTETLTDDSLPF